MLALASGEDPSPTTRAENPTECSGGKVTGKNNSQWKGKVAKTDKKIQKITG